MIDMTHTVTIDRPVDEVFDFVAEPSNEPKWHFDVKEVVRPTQGPLALNTTYEWVVRFLGTTKTYVGEVTAFEPNRFIEMTTREGPILPKLTHTFQAAGDHTTYTRRVRFETKGLFKVMEPLIKRMPSPNTRWADNLKLLLEGGQPR